MPRATAAALALLLGAAAAAKPHLVFFLVRETALLQLPPLPPPRPDRRPAQADDYGFADVSYHTEMYGRSANVIHTPNLDRLSAAGVRLENYYVQPVCSPTVRGAHALLLPPSVL